MLSTKIKNVVGLMENELGGNILKELPGLRVETYNYLTGNNDGDKIAKCTKKCVIKRKLKFKEYKNCLKANQIKGKINQLEKNKVNVDNFKENHIKFKENNKLKLKYYQRFRSKKT